ncbi:hypothetical protein N7539_002915 [Penicillium diatomitis]|uniref:Ubiquitin-like domain-containing protein n=1 Tax=Penicillium diatomitis TaxID=2819901 RepID=A0A9W9XGG9_9EURO|nr:uncharacterized protein N7539_002915 [Penicillium diatomitis]KAJ5491348.1 hypothetical protein N7539_002915 [Penicillium diatomitis]
MASSETPATVVATPTAQQSDNSPQMITINVLNPSLPSPGRVTLRDVPLETTVGQLRRQISKSLPNQALSTTQRLIYLGRVLVNDNSTLSETFGPVEQTEFSIHLVLPPAPSPATQNAPGSAGVSSVNGSGPLPAFLASHMAAVNNAMRQAADSSHSQVQHVSNHTQSLVAAQTWPHASIVHGNPASGRENDEYDVLRRELEKAENEVNHHLIPSHESLYQLRRRIEQQRQHRLAASQAQPGTVDTSHDFDSLHQRVEALYQRIDSLPPNPSQRADQPFLDLRSHQTIYLLSAPDGRKSLIIPPLPSASPFVSRPTPSLRQNLPLTLFPSTSSNVLHPPSDTLNHGQTSGQPQPTRTIQPNQADNGHPRGQNPAVILQNALNQRAANAQPRREIENILAGNFVSRIWLFMRLYFFIFMITNPGSWTRYLLVTVAVLVTLASESSIPERLHGALIAPVQRHLERLTQMGGPADPARPAAGAGAERNARNPAWGELWATVQSLERAVVLLLASLVPGIGERQVEARNAAEAEAQRQRQEEQQRLLEQQREQEEQQRATAAEAENQSVSQSDDVARGAETEETVNEGSLTEQPQPEKLTATAS